ncbi:phytoene desaturase family protein [Sphingomonas sp. BGYR3]|uniref:1-hydroxycarotenoid 3,4-desaturase CrtD n=1 Tax=Sphingomonas sp. BGYR3 TaxID=2975483 RepID=UPI0021A44BE4|nr:1-hydroxycarotenoid 3,4-desaturase CrtD [Sphingomonas sp. BGYR3]MDG5487713.1 phytoene desaturase family protein [Sphingomonas sp. BGYR3]
MEREPIIVIGAGIGGLVSALLLAARGERVTVIEQAAGPGGKVRKLPVGDVGSAAVDAGPTVFTLRSVFDAIFADAGERVEDHLTLRRADILARHAWNDAETLDLHADFEASCDAVGRFAGRADEAGFRSFSAEARRIFQIVDAPFMRAAKPLPPQLMWRIGLWRVGALLAIRPYESLWKVLGEHFSDPRLVQLFGRYSTYCGSSPFRTPATLMLIADVEAQGVWAIDGGISALAAALERLARARGVTFHYGRAVGRITVARRRVSGVELADGQHLSASAIVFNGDPAALGQGLLGPAVRRATRPMRETARSLSAMVWLAEARTSGFDLAHHNVFFSDDYPAEFADIAAGRPPRNPTAYVCALDRGGGRVPDGPERFQVIVNAPANGDRHSYSDAEKDQCTSTMLERLSACGLTLADPLPHRLLTPTDFSTRFPGTGGALYGRASHGWAASFLRPGSRTAIHGLYCAGGATHPGAGVPMAALSGRLASEAVLADRPLTRWFHRRAIDGGMSTRSAMTGASG